ncbi:MAG: L-threonylcarbamoyladenylate synthase [Bacteroidia bacterium]
MKTVIGTDLNQALAHLRAGQVIGIPTETVYGLAANALDPAAVVHIFEVKKRPTFNPLIVHVHHIDQFSLYASHVPEQIMLLAKQFSPGPITFVLPKKACIPDLVTAGGDTVALRVPAHPLTLQLLQQLDFPLAAPSANPFGYISPVTAKHVADQLGEQIPFILDGGPCQVGVESTVVGMIGNEVAILRLGGISVEAIEAVVGKVILQINQSSNPQSPGQLKAHYAPRIKLILGNLNKLIEQNTLTKKAVLAFREIPAETSWTASACLSPTGDFHEAARNLFAALRQLDQSDAELILAERLPDSDLGRAINDRLERAAAEHENA